MKLTRRGFLAGAGALSLWRRDARAAVAAPKQIKAFCIDFNWHHARGKGSVFAKPGHWADASPEEHVNWYHDLGANTIQTFCVSCNGYAWYKGGFVPEQPGLKHDFLTEMVRLGHKKDMLVTGYFCAGANSKWGHDHPALSYGAPSTLHIPFTDPYLDYLCRSMEDAIRRTGLDGYMVDWLWNPNPELRKNGWIDAEKKLFSQLLAKRFPASGTPSPEDLLAYERKAIERCWTRIRETRDRTRRDCILWLSVSNLTDPTIAGSLPLRETDWVLNEAPNPEYYERGRKMAGAHTRVLQNLVGWVQHDAKQYLADPRNRDRDFYGFAEPRDNSLPLPVADYLAKPVEAFNGKDSIDVNDRNIAALARFYRGMPLDRVVRRS